MIKRHAKTDVGPRPTRNVNDGGQDYVGLAEPRQVSRSRIRIAFFVAPVLMMVVACPAENPTALTPSNTGELSAALEESGGVTRLVARLTSTVGFKLPAESACATVFWADGAARESRYPDMLRRQLEQEEASTCVPYNAGELSLEELEVSCADEDYTCLPRVQMKDECGGEKSPCYESVMSCFMNPWLQVVRKCVPDGIESGATAELVFEAPPEGLADEIYIAGSFGGVTKIQLP